jgi:hypothetical protein
MVRVGVGRVSEAEGPLGEPWPHAASRKQETHTRATHDTLTFLITTPCCRRLARHHSRRVKAIGRRPRLGVRRSSPSRSSC